MPPVQPMLAKSVKGIPDPAKHGGLLLRAEVGRLPLPRVPDGDEVELASRNTKPLTRYFPEVVEAMREQLPERCVLDGEIFVAPIDGDRLEFETLQERIHPADSRVRHAGGEDPGRLRRLRPARARRRVVRRPAVRGAPRRARGGAGRRSTGPCYLTRTTTDPAEAEEWFHQFEGAGLDGVVAKPLGAPYQPERPHDAQDQARAHRRRGASPATASTRPRTPERPLLGSLLLGPVRRDGQAAAHRRQRQLHRGRAAPS